MNEPNDAIRSEAPAASPASAAVHSPRPSKGPLQSVLDLFSSVKLGIWLMAILFVYSSIGSAGIVYPDFAAGNANIFSAENWAHDQLRQWRGLEMTEFEWFHWWPFDLMMILLAVNLVVTTVRRIPFKPVNYGVWGIHTGIIVLIVGSFIYFGVKVEGDTPVARRTIVAEFDAKQADGSTKLERIAFVASPGQRVERGEGARRIMLEVRSIDPAWEILTGDDKGKRAYSVTVAIEREGKRYLRQVLAGYPQLTEDLIFTADEAQPVKRSVKETGSPIYDEGLTLSLDYAPQEWFYLRNDLAKSWALYLRPKANPGEAPAEWTERRIEGLPLYNDYIGSRDAVYQMGGDDLLPLDPIDIAVGPTSEGDPFKDVGFRVNGYLRYAIPRSRAVDGGPSSPVNPIAMVEVASEQGLRAPYRLIALDPQQSRADEGLLRFVHLADESQFERFTRQPAIRLRIPAKGIEVREEIRDVAAANPDAPFVEIKGTEEDGKAAYAYRVMNVRDNVPIGSTTVSVAILEVRTPRGLFRRWVFSDPSLTRDVVQPDASDAHGAPKMQDDSRDARARTRGGTPPPRQRDRPRDERVRGQGARHGHAPRRHHGAREGVHAARRPRDAASRGAARAARARPDGDAVAGARVGAGCGCALDSVHAMGLRGPRVRAAPLTLLAASPAACGWTRGRGALLAPAVAAAHRRRARRVRADLSPGWFHRRDGHDPRLHQPRALPRRWLVGHMD